MKYRISNKLKVSLAVIGIAVVSLFFSGCEGDANERTFQNDSTHRVTLYEHYYVVGLDSTPGRHILEPGEKYVMKVYSDSTLYYDWEPKNTVNAREANDHKVVFENK